MTKVAASAPTPILGQLTPEISTPVSATAAAKAALLPETVDIADLKAYASKLLTTGVTTLPPSIQKLLGAPPPPPKGATLGFSTQVEARLARYGAEVNVLLARGAIGESDLGDLAGAETRLTEILNAFNDKKVLRLLAPDVKTRLVEGLLRPLVGVLEELIEVRRVVMTGAMARDQEPLRKVLSSQVTFKPVRPEEQDIGLSAFGRYVPGDRVVILNAEGVQTQGVVAGHSRDHTKLRIEGFTSAGKFFMKEVDQRMISSFNPLKIGDSIELRDGRTIDVRGLNGQGEFEVLLRQKSGATLVTGAALERLTEDVSQLVMDAHLDPVSNVHQSSSSAIDGIHLRAGGAETPANTVDAVRGPAGSGALVSTRGPNKADHGVEYKAYNEDGGVVGTLRGKKHTVLFGAVADQAGGAGEYTRGGAVVTGGSSEVAVEAFMRAAQAIADGQAPKDAFADMIAAAKADIDAVNKGRHGVECVVTTLVGTIVVGSMAYTVNIGDSRAEIYKRNNDGSASVDPTAVTAAHNGADEALVRYGIYAHPFQSVVTSSIGAEVRSDLYAWDLRGGSRFIVLGSDGLFDISRPRKDNDSGVGHIGRTQAAMEGALRDCKTAEEATLALQALALNAMTNGAKPDNLTVVVLDPTQLKT